VCGGPLYILLLDKCPEYPALLTEVISVSNLDNQWHAWVHSIVSTPKVRFNHDLPEEQSTISFYKTGSTELYEYAHNKEDSLKTSDSL